MKANPKFNSTTKVFWAIVRSVGQTGGYTNRKTKKNPNQAIFKIPKVADIAETYAKLGLDSSQIIDSSGNPTAMGALLEEYFEYRADILEKYVEPRLMDAARAKSEFDKMSSTQNSKCPIPMNKQKGIKRAPAYLTAITNMIVEKAIGALPCDYDPRELTTVTVNGFPVRTMARRVDGAFPKAINPIAIWEIKEYYYTTTFGSRVADGVYETLLDGLELEELKKSEGIDIKHYLILDAHYTWWDCGKSYLCRIIDMLHMGYLDEVLFGYEVIERLPAIVGEWVKIKNAQPKP